ncbi:MAG TPA: phosphoribosylanthranilate isomerase [Planctomycetota bacterium]|nr:phosphoribosylanthranilate isomerase [Planctomycetota bacterium]
MPTRIKICGVRRAGDVHAASRLGVEAVGLNFVPESPRYVGGIEAAKKLIAASVAPDMQWAGVFVNPTMEQVKKTTTALNLRIVQLHGEELPAFVREVKQALGVTVWKALRVSTAADLKVMDIFECDGFVVDAKVPGVRGGSGKTFDWNILKDISRKAPLILSGGLKPANVAAAIAAVSPDWVDVASGVESAPGVKNAELIREFVLNARH